MWKTEEYSTCTAKLRPGYDVLDLFSVCNIFRYSGTLSHTFPFFLSFIHSSFHRFLSLYHSTSIIGASFLYDWLLACIVIPFSETLQYLSLFSILFDCLNNRKRSSIFPFFFLQSSSWLSFRPLILYVSVQFGSGSGSGCVSFCKW